MSLVHQITERIRRMVGLPAGAPFNALAALDTVENGFEAQQALIAILVNERTNYRAALTGLAMDFGLAHSGWGGERQPMSNLVLLSWPVDPEPKEEKRIVEPKGLVSLH